MDEKQQKALEDAGMVFLWKIKEASQGYRKSVKKIFGNSFATSTLQAFDEAIDNFTSEYMNDVNTVFGAFSENMEQLVEPIVKPESHEHPQPLYVIDQPEDLPIVHEIKQEHSQKSGTDETLEEETTRVEETNTQENVASEQEEFTEKDGEQAMLMLENYPGETTSEQLEPDSKADITHLKQETVQEHEQVAYEPMPEMEFTSEGQEQQLTEDAVSGERQIKGESELEAEQATELKNSGNANVLALLSEVTVCSRFDSLLLCVNWVRFREIFLKNTRGRFCCFLNGNTACIENYDVESFIWAEDRCRYI